MSSDVATIPALELPEEVAGWVADGLAPPERLTPSEWAEGKRILKEGTTPQPGPWRNDFFPWYPQIVDIMVNEPWKRGYLEQKSAQSGGSEGGVNLVGYFVDQRPGPILYLCSTDTLARSFSLNRFEYMIETTPSLEDKFLRGREHHETLDDKRYAGGRLVIFGSQSPNKLMSDPFQYVLLDEIDRLPNFPKVGSAWGLAGARTQAYPAGRTFIAGWSTPTIEGEGIARLMEELTDQRRLFVECPHCGGEFWLKFGQVRIDDRKAETARYECEGCEHVITDTERAASVYRGKFKTTLPKEEADAKPFAGFYISQLYNPRITIREIAEKYLRCKSEADLQVFFNTVLGEPYTPAARPVTEDDIDARATMQPKETLPDTVGFLTAGIDVQHGFWFYVDVSGWTGDSVKYLVSYERIQGWERLASFLRTFYADTQSGRLKIRLAGIDAEYQTSQVYNFCKQFGSGVVPCWYGSVPQGGFSHIKHRKLSNVHVHVLKREHWMERAMGRFVGDVEYASVVLPVGVTDEYKGHILSNVRTESVDRSGRRKYAWIKAEKGLRDDWLHAAVYSEYAATLLGLDAIQELGEKEKQAKKALAKKNPAVMGKMSWVKREKKKKARGGGFIFR